MKSSLIDSLSALPEPERIAILADLTETQIDQLVWDWKAHARPDQIAPPGGWMTWLILAGRGWGKTRTGAETIRDWVCGDTPLGRGMYGRIALVAETAADGRDVMVEGDSGILSVHPPEYRPHYEPSKRRLTWPNGAVATVFNGTEPGQLRGPQFDAAWIDEIAKYKYAREAWDMLQFGLRLGSHPRQVVTTTPRPIPLIKELIASPTSIVTNGRTMDNAHNLAEQFLGEINRRYSGTRLGRQELDAEVLDDLPGALWTRDMFDDHRRTDDDIPDMQRIVVAVDPSGVASEEDSGDSQGVVVAGLGVDDRGYVLADRSCKMSPGGWGRRAVEAYDAFDADRIVAEKNYGGAMVEHVVRTVNPLVSYSHVTATRGKVIRAEPVAALFEQGRVSMVGNMADLEDQCCMFSHSGYLGDGSPDRLDAMVWALTELMLENKSKKAGTLW